MKEVAILRFDGSYRMKKSTGSAGGSLFVGNIEVAIVREDFKCSSPVEAEYRALICTIQKALELGFKHLKIEGDNEVVIKQMNNDVRCHDKSIKRLRGRARMLASFLDSVSFTWIPREQNKRADELSKRH